MSNKIETANGMIYRGSYYSFQLEGNKPEDLFFSRSALGFDFLIINTR